MLKQISVATLITLTALTIGSLPIHAQIPTTNDQTVTDPAVLLELGRAANLARQAAEKANGGLGNYRAESSMFGPPTQTPHTSTNDGWTFTIKGRRPESSEYTIETVVNVARGGNVAVDYNGPIRSSGR
jgi:hypothetical protein